MPKYIVKDGHKKHDGREYAPGDVIECDEETAKALRLEPVLSDEKPAKGKK